jgi:adenylate cyclase
MVALALGFFMTGAAGALRVADPLEVRLVRELVFDEFQRLAPRPYRPGRVRVVDIDEASLAQFGQWPWPRSNLARLVERLHHLGAAAVAFDMVFPEPDRLSPSRIARQADLLDAIGPDLAEAVAHRLPDNDALFADAIRGRPVVLGFALNPGTSASHPDVRTGFAFTGADPRAALPRFSAAAVNLPLLEAAASGLGAMTLSPLEVQGVVRRIPLLWSDGSRIYPSLLVEALRVAAQDTTLLVHSRASPPFATTAVAAGGFEIPVTAAGELRVWFSHQNPRRSISAARLLSTAGDPALRNEIAGNIVFVGTSAAGLFDARATPLAETVPGVTVHAQAVEQILTGDYLLRPDWVDPFESLWIVLMGALVAIVAVFYAPVTALVYGACAAAVTVVGAWVAFRSAGLLLDPAFPSAAGLLLYLVLISFRYFVSDRERRFVRQAFSRYVAPSYLTQIEENPASLRLGGEERELTVLFLDIRDFTALSEQLSPTEVVEFLNLLFGRFSADILAEGGTIDKYIGDSLMAFWNAPFPAADHPVRACRAALRMRQSLRELNDQDAFRFRQRPTPLPGVAVGIGINTGLALVGNMGSEIRFNYSVVGDAVNVASRVEGQCKPLSYDIVCTRTVAAAAPDLAWLPAGTIDLRGKAGREDLSILVGDGSLAATERFRDLRETHDRLLRSLREGSGGWGELVSACVAAAEAGFPGLREFYSRLMGRVRDFGSAPPRERVRDDGDMEPGRAL